MIVAGVAILPWSQKLTLLMVLYPRFRCRDQNSLIVLPALRLSLSDKIIQGRISVLVLLSPRHKIVTEGITLSRHHTSMISYALSLRAVAQAQLSCHSFRRCPGFIVRSSWSTGRDFTTRGRCSETSDSSPARSENSIGTPQTRRVKSKASRNRATRRTKARAASSQGTNDTTVNRGNDTKSIISGNGVPRTKTTKQPSSKKSKTESGPPITKKASKQRSPDEQAVNLDGTTDVGARSSGNVRRIGSENPVVSDKTTSFSRLNKELRIGSAARNTKVAKTQTFITRSAKDDMITKLKDALNANRRLAAKNILVELLKTGAFTEKARRIILQKLKASLTSVIPQRIEDIVEAADTTAGILSEGGAAATEGKGVTIKEAMSRSPVDNDIEDVISKPRFADRELGSINSDELVLVPQQIPQPPVPGLAYGLDRALFNPGVYHLRDPRSRVFNFDPYLQKIMPVAEFDFNALKEYVTSSKDQTLVNAARKLSRKYTGSTSSMTSALAHFHYLLSHWRPPNVDNLSKGFPAEPLSFSAVQRSPAAIFLRYNDGVYAIDADKEYDEPTVLSMLGKSMEKLLTLPKESFERYHKDRSGEITAEERDEKESFHYTTMSDFLMRSQLDAHDPRLPGTGMFDLKTRAVVSIRMDAANYEAGRGYEIQGRHGEFTSFEREYFDLIRSAFLKYSLQVRMGRMDGIYVAYHNTERIFGFQYISLPEMDKAMHGTENLTIGDAEFKLSLELLNRVLDRATAKWPKQSLRIHFETRPSETKPFMYIFAKPVTNEEMDSIQNAKKDSFAAFERNVLGLRKHDYAGVDQDDAKIKLDRDNAEMEALQAEVEEQIKDEELSSIDAAASEPLDEEAADRELSEFLKEVEDDASEELVDHARSEDDASADKVTGSVSKRDEIDDNDVSQVEQDSVVEEDYLESTEDPDSASQVDHEATRDLIDESSSDVHAVMDRDQSSTEDLSSTQQQENTSSLDGAASDAITSSSKPKRMSTKKSANSDELLTMFLVIRNKVDGEAVERPENLTKDQKWTADYALATLPEDSGKVLYQSAIKRRQKVLARKEDLSPQRQRYVDMIAEYVEQSMQYRAEENALDAVHGQYMYGETKPREFAWSAPASKEPAQGTEEGEEANTENNDSIPEVSPKHGAETSVESLLVEDAGAQPEEKDIR